MPLSLTCGLARISAIAASAATLVVVSAVVARSAGHAKGRAQGFAEGRRHGYKEASEKYEVQNTIFYQRGVVNGLTSRVRDLMNTLEEVTAGRSA
ncbi:hypothetical protein [Microbispora corallina]